jgi:hypothetical protein
MMFNSHPKQLLQVLMFIVDLTVSLTSNPSGPLYQAAIWITFQCSATSGSGLYRYKWRVYCSSTGALVFESVVGSEVTFRIKSTPSVCYDKVECVAEDTVLPLTGSGSETISSVTGI